MYLHLAYRAVLRNLLKGLGSRHAKGENRTHTLWRGHKLPWNYRQRIFSSGHFTLICFPMVLVRSILGTVSGAVRGRASVKAKKGSWSSAAKGIVSAVGAENSIFVTRFSGSVESCLCQLLLLVGAIAKAKETAGTVPCSKICSKKRLIITHFALSAMASFQFDDG